MLGDFNNVWLLLRHLLHFLSSLLNDDALNFYSLLYRAFLSILMCLDIWRLFSLVVLRNFSLHFSLRITTYVFPVRFFRRCRPRSVLLSVFWSDLFDMGTFGWLYSLIMRIILLVDSLGVNLMEFLLWIFFFLEI